MTSVENPVGPGRAGAASNADYAVPGGKHPYNDELCDKLAKANAIFNFVVYTLGALAFFLGFLIDSDNADDLGARMTCQICGLAGLTYSHTHMPRYKTYLHSRIVLALITGLFTSSFAALGGDNVRLGAPYFQPLAIACSLVAWWNMGQTIMSVKIAEGYGIDKNGFVPSIGL